MVIILNNLRKNFTIFSRSKKFFHSLKWKIVALYLSLSIIPLIIFSNIVSNSINNYFTKRAKENYSNRASILASNLSKDDYFKSGAIKTLNDSGIIKETDINSTPYRIMFLNKFGVIVFDNYGIFNSKSEYGKTYLLTEVIESLKGNDAINIYPDEKAIYTTSPVFSSSSDVEGVVLLVASLSDNFTILEEINGKVLLMTIFFVIIVATIMYIVTRSILNILISFSAIVERMAEGKLDARVKVVGDDEFSDLGKSFNHMADKIQQGEKTREEFVSNVSHELKTPLSSIKILSDSILFQEKVSEEIYKEFLQDIVSEVDRMTFIINDLLTLVRLDQGETGLNLEKVDVGNMIQNIMKRLLPLAEEKNIQLRFNDNNKKVIIDADEVKLTLAISNLIENGIKYTNDGGMVKVTMDSNHQFAFITVQDTGIGISEEEQTKVFNRFYRVDKTRDRETGGTGLGLSITHNTVLIHNGSIKLTSKDGEGSTFAIRIPLVYVKEN